jgi:hypothetical protein
MTGKHQNLTEVAAEFGVEASTVIAWVKRGCPYLSRDPVGKKTRWAFDINAVRIWRENDIRRIGRDIPQPPLVIARPRVLDATEKKFQNILRGLLNPKVRIEDN